jgi:hypothetical protein
VELSAAGYTVLAAAALREPLPPQTPDVLAELAAAGALARAADGAWVVDPALQVALQAAAGATVTVDAAVRDGPLRVFARCAVAGSLAVCTVHGRRDGRALDRVRFGVTGLDGALPAVLAEVPDLPASPPPVPPRPPGDPAAVVAAARRSLWLRVRGPGHAAVEYCVHGGDGWLRAVPDDGRGGGHGGLRLCPVTAAELTRSATSALVAALEAAAAAATPGRERSWR